jgi:tRNA dimethylallyltransferase
MKKVIVIVGPTGSGKTGLSIKLAEALGAEIINGDSVQIYKGLDIGSAKISKDEMGGVTHHLLGVVNPGESYTVYNFQKDVRGLIEEIKLPMIVGGTGLYIKAALYDYEFVESGRSESFDETYDSKTNEEIYQMLLALDPDIKIELNNRRRMLRALNQALLGEKRSSKTKKDDLLYDAKIIYLDLDRSILETRLIERLDKQLEQGFISEVEDLRNKGHHVSAIGYRELEDYLNGILTLEEAKAKIIKSSKGLAKKQKTWFKNQMNPIMLDALSPTLYEEALSVIKAWMREDL